MKTALVLLNGQPPCKPLIKKLWDLSDFRIAVDGGANHALQYGLIPDMVLGDFDSVEHKTRELLDSTIFMHAPNQDYTDGEKSLKYLFENKEYNQIHIAGGTGNRLDHSLYLLGLLKSFYSAKVRITVWNDFEKWFVINKSSVIRGRKGQRISFFPLGAPVANLTLEGAKYSFENKTLATGSFTSISNRFESDKISLTFKEGWILVSLEL